MKGEGIYCCFSLSQTAVKRELRSLITIPITRGMAIGRISYLIRNVVIWTIRLDVIKGILIFPEIDKKWL